MIASTDNGLYPLSTQEHSRGSKWPILKIQVFTLQSLVVNMLTLTVTVIICSTTSHCPNTYLPPPTTQGGHHIYFNSSPDCKYVRGGDRGYPTSSMHMDGGHQAFCYNLARTVEGEFRCCHHILSMGIFFPLFHLIQF